MADCLYSDHFSEPDLLVRTSGEVRLSDFLLWQSSFSLFAFANVLWPEFTIWDLYSAIFYYQRHYSKLCKAKNVHEKQLQIMETATIQREFELSEMNDVDMFIAKRKVRIETFLKDVNDDRLFQLENMREGNCKQEQLVE